VQFWQPATDMPLKVAHAAQASRAEAEVTPGLQSKKSWPMPSSWESWHVDPQQPVPAHSQPLSALGAAGVLQF
jgi:hypothetical protein